MTCRWCSRPARFLVSAIRRGRPAGGHDACGVHLARAVEFVTVPGSHADVERL